MTTVLRTASAAHDPGVNHRQVIQVNEKPGDTVRLVHHRTVVGDCLDCPRTFAKTSAAASHAKSRRHTVQVDYYTAFSYAPGERVNRA